MKRLKAIRDEALQFADTKLDEVLEILTVLEMDEQVISQGWEEHDYWTAKSMIACLKKFCVLPKESTC